MSLTDLTDFAHHEFAWLLEVAGSTRRFWSGQVPPTTAMSNGGNYTDVQCIETVGRQMMRLNERGGISDFGAVRVVLSSAGELGSSTDDPRRLFRRFGVKGVAAYCRITQDIPHAVANIASVTVDRDVTGWPVGPGALYTVHVGQETWLASGVAAGPDRFTTVRRAQLLTQPWSHMYSPASGQQSTGTSDIADWRGRRVVLKIAPVLGRALVASDYHEVVKGFIDQTPTLEQGGIAVSMTIMPLTAVLKMRGGGDTLTSRLLHKVHHFSGGDGAAMVHTQIAEQGELYADTSGALSAAAGAALNVLESDLHDRWSDVGRPDGHPRRLPIIAHQAGAILPMNATAYPAANAITLEAGEPNINVPPATQLRNKLAWDVIEATICAPNTTDTQYWPDEALAAINATTGWAPGSTSGADGAWCDVVLTEDSKSPGRYALFCKLNAKKPQTGVRLEFRSLHGGRGRMQGDYFEGQQYTRPTSSVLWYPFDLARPDEPNYPGPSYYRRADPASILSWTREEPVSVSDGDDEEPQQFQIRGIAHAFWQNNEPTFSLEDSIISAATWFQVEWSEPNGERYKQFIRVTAVTTQNDPLGNAVGYRYTVDRAESDEYRCFGDWPGQERALIRPVSRWRRTHPGRILLEHLESARGGAVNGAYDTQPSGMNIDEADLHEASFLNLPAPGPLAAQDIDLVGEVDTAKFASQLLISTSATLAMKYNPADRTQRIALIPVGLEFADDSRKTFTNADVAAAPVESLTDDECIARYEIRLNFDTEAGEYKSTFLFVDAKSVVRQGGDAPKIDIELRGVHVEEISNTIELLRPFTEGLMRRFGQPRLRFRFQVPTHMVIGLNLGDDVTVTLADAVGYDGTWGVTAMAGRVAAMDIDWSGEGAELEVVTYAARTVGWAPSWTITAAVDADTVTVAANDNCATVNPITGAAQTDATFIQAGDVVDTWARGAWSARVQRTVLSVSGNDVTFTANHGYAVGALDYEMQPDAYDSTVARLRAYAFVADAARTLGAGNVAAKVYS